MAITITFDEALDAVELLAPDDQAELIAIVKRRLAERSREDLIKRVEESRREYENGQFQITDPAELIREALR